MIRAATLGLFGIATAVFAFAQNADQPERTVSDLERELFGTDGADPDAEEDEEIIESRPRTYQQFETVMLRALDKITGRSTDFEMLVGEPKVYGSLRIDLQTCYQTPPEEPPESVAFLKITSATSKQVQTMAEPRDLTEEEMTISEAEDADIRFSGWMFASSPGLSALEHPVYDIWVIACSEVDPAVLNPLEPAE
ncbi:MAG: DUF2155 domain-containing protein [Pseudomonadota bacterium]